MLIAVIGGGASGMAAAYAAASAGATVVLFEKNEKLGKKLFISGKGRCNLTNDSDISNHLAHVLTNPRFLYSAYHALSPDDLMQLIRKEGVPLKTERGGRVFPLSDKSSDVLRAWSRLLDESGAEIRLNAEVHAVKRVDDHFDVETSEGHIPFDKVILCTGGFTYQATGSTGDGYRFAETLGHSVTQLHPSLLGIRADIPKELAGLSLKNVSLIVRKGEKMIAEEFGEMLFTHTGVSGPIVLTVSGMINKLDLREIAFSVDLKPALDEEQLDDRLVREFSAQPNKSLKNVMPALMPKSLIPLVLTQASLSQEKACHSVTKEERRHLVGCIKGIRIQPIGFEDFNGAIITSGGVNVNEVNPKDMQSKRIMGLYFAGELLDVDALTGGYNLQIAFSTGYLAGISAANT